MTTTSITSSSSSTYSAATQSQPTPIFSCITCHALFSDASAQKTHYKSDWHVHNLGLKVQGLPPITESSFVSQQEGASRTEATLGFHMTKISKRNKQTNEAVSPAYFFSCEQCSKGFSSQRALDSHTRQKHDQLENEQDEEEDTSMASASNDEQQATPNPGQCFLCSFLAEDDLETLLLHLTSMHHLYIPDLTLISDLPGLISYLQHKVLVMHACLYCHNDDLWTDEKLSEAQAKSMLFRTAKAVINHMHDTGHCKLRYDEIGQRELSPFFNYYSDDKPTDADDSEYVDVDEGWDEAAMLSSSTAPSVITVNRMTPSPLIELDLDDETSAAGIIAPDQSEMLLTRSGKRVGHRSLKHVFKQNLVPYVDQEEGQRSLSASSSALVNKLLLKYREDGVLANNMKGYRTLRGGQLITCNSGSMIPMHMMMTDKEKKDQWQEQVNYSRRVLEVGIKTNRLQKHFREQIL